MRDMERCGYLQSTAVSVRTEFDEFYVGKLTETRWRRVPFKILNCSQSHRLRTVPVKRCRQLNHCLELLLLRQLATRPECRRAFLECLFGEVALLQFLEN